MYHIKGVHRPPSAPDLSLQDELLLQNVARPLVVDQVRPTSPYRSLNGSGVENARVAYDSEVRTHSYPILSAWAVWLLRHQSALVRDREAIKIQRQSSVG